MHTRSSNGRIRAGVPAGRALAITAIGLLAVAARADSPSAGPRPMPPMSASGSTGLVRIPTAEVLPYGYYAVGVNVVDRRYRPYPAEERGDSVAHFITAGFLPRLEVTARMTNHDGKLGAQFRQDIRGGQGGWNFDRMLSIQALLVPQSGRSPVSVAVGNRDVVGTGAFEARYVVVSRRWPALGVHAGLGSHTLGRLFAGVDCRPLPGIRLMLDHDGNDPNVGVTLETHHFALTPFLTGLKAFGGGITYTRPI